VAAITVVPNVKQELPTLPEHMPSHPVFSRVCVAQSFGFCVCPFFFVWPLPCISFFDLRLLITPFVSSNFLVRHYF
jgi:hypothetical protein